MIEKMHGMDGSEKRPLRVPGEDAPIDMAALEKRFSVVPEAPTGRRVLPDYDARTTEEQMTATFGTERAAEILSTPALETRPKEPHKFLVVDEVPTAAVENLQEPPQAEFNAQKSLMERLLDANAAGGTDNETMLQALRDIRNDMSLSPEERKRREQDTTSAWNAYASSLEERGLRPS